MYLRMPEDIIEHYGVRGMRWGVHRASAKASRAAHRINKVTTKYNKDKAKAKLANKILGDTTSSARIKLSERVRQNVGTNADALANKSNRELMKGATSLAKIQKKLRIAESDTQQKLNKALKSGNIAQQELLGQQLRDIRALRADNGLARSTQQLNTAARRANASKNAVTDSRKQYLTKLSKDTFGNTKNVKNMENMIMATTKKPEGKDGGGGKGKKKDLQKYLNLAKKGIKLYGDLSGNPVAKKAAQGMDKMEDVADQKQNKKTQQSNEDSQPKNEKPNYSQEDVNDVMRAYGMYVSNNAPRKDITPKKRLSSRKQLLLGGG